MAVRDLLTFFGVLICHSRCGKSTHVGEHRSRFVFAKRHLGAEDVSEAE